LVEPLNKVLRGSHGFRWGQEQTNAFADIKRAISVAPAISNSGPGIYRLYTDASNVQVGCHLIREYKGIVYNLGYGSKTLTASERNYSIPKKELFAIYFGCKHFRHMIKGQQVVVHTDHKSLSNLNMKEPSGIIARWLEFIAEIDPAVVHIPGKENVVADALSRLPVNVVELVDKDDILQCISQAHGGPRGHFGVTKTYRTIRSKYSWPNMFQDVKTFVQQCNCQIHKDVVPDSRSLMTPIMSDKPWQVVGLDLIGPHKLDSGESKHFMLAVDYYSKWVEAVPL